LRRGRHLEYVTDALNHRVRRIDQAGVVHLVAGIGIPGSSGGGGDGDAKFAQLNEPHGVAADSLGNVYIADGKNCVIRKVDTAGLITRYAGTGAENPDNPGARSPASRAAGCSATKARSTPSVTPAAPSSVTPAT
jgi:hypothetical protein